MMQISDVNALNNSLLTFMHREPITECRGIIEGEAPPNRGGVREVS